MNIFDYKYLNIASYTGNIEVDVKNLLTKNKNRKTYKHVKAVAKTNELIAEQFGLDKNKCYIAGLLHDISSIISPDDMMSYAQNTNMNIDKAESKYPFLLHQRMSRIIAEDYFGIKDNDILSSIECHTTLKSNPSQYDLALFIADKLSWDQKRKPLFYDLVYNGLSISLEHSSYEYFKYMIDNNLILFPHQWFLQGKDFLENHCN